MKLFKKVAQKRQHKKTLKSLKTLPERTLRDCGFSPELMSLGTAGYPWRNQ